MLLLGYYLEYDNHLKFFSQYSMIISKRGTVYNSLVSTRLFFETGSLFTVYVPTRGYYLEFYYYLKCMCQHQTVICNSATIYNLCVNNRLLFISRPLLTIYEQVLDYYFRLRHCFNSCAGTRLHCYLKLEHNLQSMCQHCAIIWNSVIT